MKSSHPHGVWTPDARTLCVACHNALEPRPSWWRPAGPARAHNANNVAAPCDSCGQLAWQRSDVGMLRNLVARFEGACLEQTGGMNCAARVDISADRTIIVTSAEDTEDDAMPGSVVVCLFERDAWQDGDGGTDLLIGVPVDKAVAEIKRLNDETHA